MNPSFVRCVFAAICLFWAAAAQAAPSITGQPVSTNVLQGGKATFTVTATGAGRTYRWQHAGTNIYNGDFSGRVSGATNASVVITNVQPMDGGGYQCIVSNSTGSVTSSVATLTVLTPPTFTQQPASVAVTEGSDFTLSATATGTAPLAYQWRKFGNNLTDSTHVTGAASNVLTVYASTTNDADVYRLIVTNSYGSVTSAAATVTVNPPPCAPAGSGLVGWWTAEGMALDAASTNHGAVQSGVSYGPGKVGQTFNFDGTTNAYVTVPDAPELQLTNELSIEFWFRKTDVTGRPSGETIVNKGGDWVHEQLNYSAALAADPFGHGMAFLFAGGNRHAGYINDTNWHHYAIVATNGAVDPAIYIDGALNAINRREGVSNINLYPSTQPLYIGAQWDPSYANYFTKGGIDELALYNRGLTPAEVQADYLAGRTGKCPLPPTFQTTPADRTNVTGTTTVFTAVVTGTQPLTYRWLLNGAALTNDARHSGATAAQLVVAGLVTNDAGGYQLVASNLTGSVTSSVVTLGILVPPQVVTNPTNVTAVAGYTIALSGSATGSGPLSFQWLHNGTNFIGDTNVITLANLDSGAGGNYRFIVTGPGGSATSAVAVVTVVFPPSVTTPPASQAANVGSTVTLDVGVGGTAPFSFQWLFNGGPLSGATNEALTLNGVGTNHAGSYQVAVVNAYGAVTSAPAVLDVGYAPTFTGPLAGQTVGVGDFVSFSPAAIGSPSISYQWYFNGIVMPGVVSNLITLANVTTNHTGIYSIVASNAYGTATLSANLTVLVTPCANTPPDLVAWWRAEGNGADQTARHPGTFPSGMAFGPGKYAQAFDLTTSSRRMTVPDSPDFQLTNAISLAVWVNIHSYSGLIMFRGDNRPGLDAFSLDAYATNAVKMVLCDQNNNTATVAAPVPTNQWQFLVATWNRATGQLKLYVNGQLGAQTTTGIIPSGALDAGNDPAIGIGNHGGTVHQFPFDGLIDEPQIYSRALTDAEIAAAYTNSNIGPCSAPPQITQQPVGVTVNEGQLTNLSVVATGAQPLAYRWLFNGMPLVDDARHLGTGTSNLLFFPAQRQDAASYTCVITNAFGSVTSSNAPLIVRFPPAVTLTPTNQFGPTGGSITFTPVFTGTAPFLYQWFKDGSPLAGATNATFTLAGLTTNDAGSYQVAVTNDLGDASAAASLAVLNPPVITLQPVSQTNFYTSNTVFTVAATGDGTLSYRWRANGTPLSDTVRVTGTAAPTLNFSNLTPAEAADYDCVITNLVGSVTSSVATLTVVTPPLVVIQPATRMVVPGQSNFFSASFMGTQPISYQWQFNNVDIPGATNNTYSQPAVGFSDFGAYRLMASNAVGVTFTTNAQLLRGSVIVWGNTTYGQTNVPLSATNLIAVAVGGSSYSSGTPTLGFTVGLRADGTVVAWGSSTYNLNSPPASATNVVAISAGSSFAMALRGDGTVVTWGNTPDIGLPTNLTNIIAIAAGNNYGLALRSDGRIIVGSVNTSAQVAGLTNLVKISSMAAGVTHTLALREDGAVSGTGSTLNESQSAPGPMPIPGGLSGIMAIAAGYSDSIVLRSNGTVFGWGSTNYNKLAAQPSLTNVIAIAAGNHFNMALRTNGTVTIWGRGEFGQTNVPAFVSNVVAIAAGSANAAALLGDGRPLIVRPPVGGISWPNRSYKFSPLVIGNGPMSYQWLMNGTNLPGATNLTLVLTGLQFSANYQLVASNALGVATSVAVPLTISGSSPGFITPLPVLFTNYVGGKLWLNAAVSGYGPVTWQWKFNGTNIVGATNEDLVIEPLYVTNAGAYSVTATSFNGPLPTSIISTQRVSQLRAWGYSYTEAPLTTTNIIAVAPGFYGGNGSSQNEYWGLRSDGKLTNWGYQFAPDYIQPANVSNATVTAIAAGNGHSLALISGGTVVAWGATQYGTANVPASATNVAAIACGDSFDAVLRNDGQVIYWFNGISSNVLAPFTNIVAIAAGQNTSSLYGLRADGQLYVQSSFPNSPANFGVSNIIAISIGTGNFGVVYALLANGTVTNFGSTSGKQTIPADWTNIVAISSGYTHVTALRADGTLATLGGYYSGNALLPGPMENVIGLSTGGDHDVALFGPRTPAITVQAFDRTLARGSNTTFHVRAVSPVAPSYQWLFNGAVIPNATNWSLTISNAQFTNAGAYQLVVSNQYGVTASKPAKLVVSLPLADAMDTIFDPFNGRSSNTWASAGLLPWFGQTNTTHDGVDGAQSAAITHLQESTLSTTVTNTGPTPGTVRFWWKVSSEFGFDFLEVRVNGTVQASISGETAWEQRSLTVPTNVSTISWRYYKDASGTLGQDAGWVDQFTYTPGPPLIVSQSSSRSVTEPTDTAFLIGVSGTPPLYYRWFKDGTNLVSTGNSVVFAPVTRTNAGVYSVIVSNAGGFAQGSNVTLTVTAPQLLGTPTVGPDGSLLFFTTDADGSLPPPELLANFELQASDTLTNWITLADGLSYTNGVFQVRDPSATNRLMRYYRIIEH